MSSMLSELEYTQKVNEKFNFLAFFRINLDSDVFRENSIYSSYDSCSLWTWCGVITPRLLQSDDVKLPTSYASDYQERIFVKTSATCGQPLCILITKYDLSLEVTKHLVTWSEQSLHFSLNLFFLGFILRLYAWTLHIMHIMLSEQRCSLSF